MCVRRFAIRNSLDSTSATVERSQPARSWPCHSISDSCRSPELRSRFWRTWRTFTTGSTTSRGSEDSHRLVTVHASPVTNRTQALPEMLFL
jgi:hypothetical protein